MADVTDAGALLAMSDVELRATLEEQIDADPAGAAKMGLVSSGQKMAASLDLDGLFKKIWKKIKAAACADWNEEESEIEDWIERVTDLIAAKLGLPGAFIKLGLVWAGRKGMAAMCAVD